MGPAIGGAVIDRAGYRPALVAMILTTAASLALLYLPLRNGRWTGAQSVDGKREPSVSVG